VSGVTVALGTVMALCGRSLPANKDTNERQNKIFLAGTKKIMRAIIGVRAFDSLSNYSYLKVYTV
jgi:hypothetical protein